MPPLRTTSTTDASLQHPLLRTTFSSPVRALSLTDAWGEGNAEAGMFVARGDEVEWYEIGENVVS